MARKGTTEKSRKRPPLETPAELSPARQWTLLALIVVVFVIAAIADLRANSATFDEGVHLAAGYSHLTSGDFRLNPEHPPLVKMIATLPLLLDRPWPARFDDLSGAEANRSKRCANEIAGAWDSAFLDQWSEWKIAHRWLYGIRDAAWEQQHAGRTEDLTPEVRYRPSDFVNDVDTILLKARATVLLFSVLLIVLTFLWTRELVGAWGGLASALLISCDPNFIVHGGLVTTDVPAACLVFGAIYLFWRVMDRVTPLRVAACGLVLGLALASKYTAAVVPPLLIALAVIRVVARRDEGAAGVRRAALQLIGALLAIGVISWVTIWGVYRFRYSAAADPKAAAAAEAAAVPGSTPRISRVSSLAGTLPLRERIEIDDANAIVFEAIRDGKTPPPNTAENQAAAKRPLISTMLLAIDRVKLFPEAWTYGFQFARGNMFRDGYLNGEITSGGVKSYFLWTALYKLPLLLLLLLAGGIVTAWRHVAPKDRLFLYLPAVVLAFMLASSGLNIGHRHSLVIYPFLYAMAGCTAAAWLQTAARWRSQIIAAAIVLIVASAHVVLAPVSRPQILWANHLPYFNELAGGPLEGYNVLADSNVDWGQDLRRLRAWIDSKGLANEPVYFNYFGTADPRWFGIAHKNAYQGYWNTNQSRLDDAKIPGYVVISAYNLLGLSYDPPDHEAWKRFLEGATLVDRVGYSIFVYRIEKRTP